MRRRHRYVGIGCRLLQYGSQTVVIPEEIEQLLSFKAAKSMKLLGFVRTDDEDPAIQRYHYMKVLNARSPLPVIVAAESMSRSSRSSNFAR